VSRNRITVDDIDFHLPCRSNLKRIYVRIKKKEQIRTKYITAVKERIPFSKYFKTSVTVHAETETRNGDIFMLLPKSISHDDMIRNIAKIEEFAVFSNRDAEKKTPKQ